MPRQDHVRVMKSWSFCLNRVDRSREGSNGERSMSCNEDLSHESVSGAISVSKSRVVR